MCALGLGMGDAFGIDFVGIDGMTIGTIGEEIDEAIGERGGVGDSWIDDRFFPFHDFSYKFGVRVWWPEPASGSVFDTAVDVAGTAFGEAEGVGGAMFATGR